MSGKYLHAITQRSTHQLSVAITTIERIAWPGDVDGDGGDTAEVSRLIVAPAAAMQSAIVDGRGGHHEKTMKMVVAELAGREMSGALFGGKIKC